MNDILTRQMPLKLGPSTLDVERRSVEVVAATENPVRIYDYERGMVNEVLLMSGAKLPHTRQVPLLDSHDSRSTASVIGSLQAMTTNNGQLTGTAYFAGRAADQWELVADGHITDFSVGYRIDPKESVWVPQGESATINGRTFEGPVLVRTAWYPKELSLVPIGADEQAKARAEARDNTADDAATKIGEKGGNMKLSPKLREMLKQRGLSDDATPEEALAALNNIEWPEERQINEERTDAARLERERVQEIQAMCNREGLEDLGKQMVADGTSIGDAKKRAFDHLMKAAEQQDQVGYRKPIEMGHDEHDKFRDAAENAIMLRSGMDGIEDRSDGLAGMTLKEIGMESLRLAGKRARGTARELIGRALMTDDFQNILANVANKSLMVGWDTAEETWQVWCGTGSFSDYRQHAIARASEAPDLLENPEGAPIVPGGMSDKKEVFTPKKYARIIPITYETIKNDDIGALTDIPMKMGEAAARLVGDVAYAILTANAAMGDGTALFASGHGNLASGGDLGAPGIATMAEAIRAMKIQTDIAGDRRLNIRPMYFIAPVELEGASEVFFRSERFSDANTVATDSSMASTQVNPYAGSYFTRVYDARLDSSSTTGWYLAAARGKTVNVYFEDGRQAPTMDQKEGWSVLGTEFRVVMPVVAKAVDWVGLYSNPNT